MSDPGYRETVSAPRWLVGMVALAAAAPLYGALDALCHGGDEAGAGRAVLAGTLVVTAGLLLVAAVVFLRLRVEAGDADLRFHFGPFGRTLTGAEIQSATAEPYRWWSFGGWGWRFGWRDGLLVQAFSVPFLRTGVRVTTRQGKRYYLSSRSPERLESAITRLTRSAQGARGREGSA